jgi:hypothetical protein
VNIWDVSTNYHIRQTHLTATLGLLIGCKKGRTSTSGAPLTGPPTPPHPMFSLSLWVMLLLSISYGDDGRFTLMRRENPLDRLRPPPLEYDNLMLFFSNLQYTKIKSDYWLMLLTAVFHKYFGHPTRHTPYSLFRKFLASYRTPTLQDLMCSKQCLWVNGSWCIWNIRYHSPNDNVSHPRRPASSTWRVTAMFKRSGYGP